MSDKFWSKINKNGPVPSDRPELGQCWVWIASLDTTGYGRFWSGTRPDRRLQPAHRISYELSVGYIPDGMDIDHLCRNRCCVNPSHLEPVTRKENLRRGIRPGRYQTAKTHCPKGHPYEGSNLFMDRGRRHCMTCKRKYQREHAREKRRSNAAYPKQGAPT